VIEQAYALTPAGGTKAMRPHSWWPNLVAEGAIFLLQANSLGDGL
jgi:hypothetical protein